MKRAAELRIGTSGWNYGDWKEIFYPPGLKSAGYLEWYARHFDTVEVNYSFYHLPRPATYEKWAGQVPENFLFAIKGSRIITHTRRLEAVRNEWRQFLENASVLGARLGPILLQFPPSLKIARDALANFLGESPGWTKLAFEFRHRSWFDPEIFELLRKFGAALVIAQSERYPQAPSVVTAPFVYLRFHGPGQLFASSYSEEQLREWAGRIKSWLSDGADVFAYFNNDFHGYALDNARTLARLCGRARV